MERLEGGSAVPQALRGGIVALGNFDGFHLGHQAVVGRAVERARAEGRPALVATFDPHPVRFFKPDLPPFRLTSLDQRQRLFAAAGADAMLVFRFDSLLATTLASEFILQNLLGDIGAAGVVTGEDFTFGRGRGGNAAVLRGAGAELGFSFDAVAPVSDADGPISSSRIREALQAGDCDTAARLLTRPFVIEGAVEHGDKRGRTIGYPTANVQLGKYLRPRYGIYAVRGRLADGRVLEGAANLGLRPMFEPRELLEAHFFDFSGAIYGQVIEVELVSFLRPEQTYENVEALTQQMGRDCLEARRRLSVLAK